MVIFAQLLGSINILIIALLSYQLYQLSLIISYVLDNSNYLLSRKRLGDLIEKIPIGSEFSNSCIDCDESDLYKCKYQVYPKKSDRFNTIPDDVFHETINLLNQHDVLNFQLTNKRFYNIGRQKLFKNIYVTNPDLPKLLRPNDICSDITNFNETLRFHNNFTIIRPINFIKLLTKYTFEPTLIEKIIISNPKFSEDFLDKLRLIFPNKVICFEDLPKLGPTARKKNTRLSFFDHYQKIPSEGSIWNLYFYNIKLENLTEFQFADSLLKTAIEKNYELPKLPKSIKKIVMIINNYDQDLKECVINWKENFEALDTLEIEGDVINFIKLLKEINISKLNINYLTLAFKCDSLLLDFHIEEVINLRIVEKFEMSFSLGPLYFVSNMFITCLHTFLFKIPSELSSLKEISIHVNSTSSRTVSTCSAINGFLEGLSKDQLTTLQLSYGGEQDLYYFKEGLKRHLNSLNKLIWIGKTSYDFDLVSYDINMITGSTKEDVSSNEFLNELIELSKIRGNKYFKLNSFEKCYESPLKSFRATEKFKLGIANLISDPQHFPKLKYIVINGIHYMINRGYDEIIEVIPIYES